VEPSRVVGIGFDATCSLVALDRDDRPITVSPTGDPDRNVIVWMDHRAAKQADSINATGHAVLRYVGGKLSPEQEPPKLKWIKEKLPETWAGAGKFLDLADFLVFRACGDDVRSQCTVVCKWTYLGHEGDGGAWDMSFFSQIDLDDLFEGGRAGTRVAPLGSRAGSPQQPPLATWGWPGGQRSLPASSTLTRVASACSACARQARGTPASTRRTGGWP
jgi:ribulose kinase